MESADGPLGSDPRLSQRFFWLGCALEAALGALGALGLLWQGRPFADWWPINGKTIALGLGATIPLLLGFHRTMTSVTGPFAPVRFWLESTATPLMRPWTLGQIAWISLLAGVGEELLFRGAIQGWASDRWGPAAGLVLASGVFGAAHSVSLRYALLTLGVGVYLGLLLQVTGSLLAPLLTHALYDFIALVYLLRLHRPLGPPEGPATEAPPPQLTPP